MRIDDINFYRDKEYEEQIKKLQNENIKLKKVLTEAIHTMDEMDQCIGRSYGFTITINRYKKYLKIIVDGNN